MTLRKLGKRNLEMEALLCVLSIFTHSRYNPSQSTLRPIYYLTSFDCFTLNSTAIGLVNPKVPTSPGLVDDIIALHVKDMGSG
jgi:hypothetical protein